MIAAVRPVSLIASLVPIALALSVAFLSFLPFGAADDFLTLGPQFVLCIIFFWTLRSPAVLPPAAIFDQFPQPLLLIPGHPQLYQGQLTFDVISAGHVGDVYNIDQLTELLDRRIVDWARRLVDSRCVVVSSQARVWWLQ